MSGVFRTKRSIYEDQGKKDKEGKVILIKVGETDSVELPEPDWSQSKTKFVAHFKAVPGVEKIADAFFTNAVTVGVQGKMRLGLVPEKWNKKECQAFVDGWIPSVGRTKKSKEERAAAELGMTPEELLKILAAAAK